jgi:hypothetical protein
VNNAADVRALPPEVQATARFNDNGEVEWPLPEARAAVDALAGAGHFVLGLDLREYDDEGRFVETAWSVTNAESLVDARDDALAALDRLDADEIGLDISRVSVLDAWR